MYLQAVERGSQKLADSTLAERRRIYESADLDPIRRTPPADLTAEDVADIWAQIYKEQQSILTESKLRRKSYEIGDKVGGDEGNIEKLKARKRALENSFSSIGVGVGVV